MTRKIPLRHLTLSASQLYAVGLRAIIIALALTGCAPGFRIIDKPISFSEERVELTRAYIESHYGISPPDIGIVPRVIVLHWTAIDDFDTSFAAFNREQLAGRPDLSSAGQVNVSIQFLVDRDGTVYRLMPETRMARHVIGLNYSAIGVENVGGEGGVDNLTDEQIEANIRLVRYLAEKYPAIEYLIGHSEYQMLEEHSLWREQDPDYRTTKIDPGERFMDAVWAGVSDLDLKGPEAIRREALAAMRTAPTGLKPPVIPHRAWGAQPPVGRAAEATRRNLALDDTLRFNDLRITVMEMVTDSSGGETPVDTAVLMLRKGTAHEEVRVAEGAALSRGGFHLVVLAVNTSEGELGGGLVELEVATVGSLPPEINAATHAGDATYRLRIPHEIRMITLHHSGSPEPLRPDDDPVQKLRDLQAWGQAERNWWDVPYHFLIDLDGNIYEGRDYRYMGETNTEYNPRGHFLISVMGNYNLQEPTPVQIDAITDLMAWAVAEFDVPLEGIHGHGDLAQTSCPGDHLREYLDDGTFREGVRGRLQEAGVR